MRPDQLERRLRERLDALGPAPRAELLHVLMLPDFERVRGSRCDEHGDGCTRELRGRAPEDRLARSSATTAYDEELIAVSQRVLR